MTEENDSERLAEVLTGIAEVLRSNRPSSNQAITINGGGLGVWIASLCCAVMLGMSVMGGVAFFTMQRQINDLQHYLQAIYMQAPDLRPKNNQD